MRAVSLESPLVTCHEDTTYGFLNYSGTITDKAICAWLNGSINQRMGDFLRDDSVMETRIGGS